MTKARRIGWPSVLLSLSNSFAATFLRLQETACLNFTTIHWPAGVRL